MTPPAPRLVLFFTRDVSLRTWADNGSLQREVALYEALAERGVDITFVTYGNREDVALGATLRGIRVAANRFELPGRAYAALAPMLHSRRFAHAVLKTNQSYGGLVAVRAKRIFRRPLVARSGYMLSLTRQRQAGAGSPAAESALRDERLLYEAADVVVVTTDELRAYAIETHALAPTKVRVIPNYVGTTLFAPREIEPEPGSVLYVGRLSEEKNLIALVDAVAAAGACLTVAGVGPLEQELRRRAAELGADVRFLRSVPNVELPDLISRAAVVALPSLWEGQPKVVLEAMACGAAVLGTDVPGTRTVLEHERTGLLSGTTSEELAAALGRLLTDPGLRRRLGAAARTEVVERYSLERVLGLELGLLEELASR